MDEAHAGAHANPHIPAEIVAKEKDRVTARRKALGLPENAEALGIALSGGGIRSATVSLGVFQYLAHQEKRALSAPATAPPLPRPLSRIDCFSSVSGGGYFGTFFGSLFLPKGEREKGTLTTPGIRWLLRAKRAVHKPVPQAEWQRAAKRATDALCDTTFDGSRMTPMRWLRENGRYLAPTGGSDYLYAVAVAIRNLLGLHYVIAVSLIAIFLLFAAFRVFGFTYFFDSWYAVETWLMPQPGANFWPSVWWVLPIASFGGVVVPIGTAFFLAQTERLGKWFRLNLPLITSIGIALPCFAYALTGAAPPFDWRTWLRAMAVADLSLSAIANWGLARQSAAYIGFSAAFAAVLYLAARFFAWLEARTRASDVEPAATMLTRTKLSQWMMVPLMVTLALAAFALVDTIGQTVYALWTVSAHNKWLAGGTTIALLVPLLKRLLPLVVGSGDPSVKAWVRIPLSTLALVAGVALFVATASLWSTLTHGLVWAGNKPVGDPGCVMIIPNEQQLNVGLDSAQRIVVAKPIVDVECATGAQPIGPGSWAWVFVPLLVISIFTGRGVGFINLSSLQKYYAGHLMRSYLRASLFAEDPNVERDVRNPTRSDDITLDAYYNENSLAPLHFINVTMNQTVASGSQLVQRDRKGMNIAIGPMGFSIGNRSFVSWDLARMNYTLQRCPAIVIGTPDDSALPRYVSGTKLVIEPMSIGNWCAISGAAFTTGHGKGTTLGLSLLLALTNVRLGYWWDAQVDRPHPTRRAPHDSSLAKWLCGTFRTQSFLLNEMFARYYGTRASHWYLSDGGHFENTAVYELIRRRVKRIIVLDNGRDEAYAFDDIANLVRKARIDLAAEIEFMTSLQLSEFVDASVRQYFGTPEEFTTDHHEPVYATLAHVHYKEAPNSPSLMLVLKPRVAGIEPLDILNYKQTSPDFPQQSTTDQFYDEAQWESYRSLGYWIAERIFKERGAVAAGKWVPRKMFD